MSFCLDPGASWIVVIAVAVAAAAGVAVAVVAVAAAVDHRSCRYCFDKSPSLLADDTMLLLHTFATSFNRNMSCFYTRDALGSRPKA